MNKIKIERGFLIPVHDHGFVRLVDWMGSDRAIVEAARVSYNSIATGTEEERDAKDKKLLTYLFKNKHTSPFEMAKVKFNIRMPIFVMQQYIRHRMQNVNEFSARYKELPDEFFVPKVWRRQATGNKQSSVVDVKPLALAANAVIDDVDGSTYLTTDISEAVEQFYKRSYEFYQTLIASGVAREQARIILPVGIYTEFYSCWDLNNLLKYFALRDDPHAQGEHQDYVRAMKEITSMFFPWTMEVYEDTDRSCLPDK